MRKMENKYPLMRSLTNQDYLKFLKTHKEVEIENVKVKLMGRWRITKYASPKDYKPEAWTVWSFPDRGDWATHVGNYRGNWSPYIPRNLILRYTREGDIVLDQMVGSGTTLVECKLLGRDGIGVDINSDAIMVALDRLNFSVPTIDIRKSKIRTYVGDARNLNEIKDESIDLIATHPPYWGIIPYSKAAIKDDLSAAKTLDDYICDMGIAAKEAYRVLKPGKHCAILIGDTRRHKHYVPMTIRVMQKFLDSSFILREDIIKMQHKMKSTREKWAAEKYDFYKIAHEHLYIFRKLQKGEKTSRFKLSAKWY